MKNCECQKKIYEDRSRLFSIGVGAMIINSAKNILLVRKNSKKIWSFPAGLLSVGEDLTGALRRELKEELGLGADFLKIEGIMGIRHRFNSKYGNNIFIIFLLKYNDGKNKKSEVNVVDKKEIAETCFFSPLEIIENDDIDWIVKEIFKKYNDGNGCLLYELKNKFKPDDSDFYKLFL